MAIQFIWKLQKKCKDVHTFKFKEYKKSTSNWFGNSNFFYVNDKLWYSSSAEKKTLGQKKYKITCCCNLPMH